MHTSPPMQYKQHFTYDWKMPPTCPHVAEHTDHAFTAHTYAADVTRIGLESFSTVMTSAVAGLMNDATARITTSPADALRGTSHVKVDDVVVREGTKTVPIGTAAC